MILGETLTIPKVMGSLVIIAGATLTSVGDGSQTPTRIAHTVYVPHWGK
jgi:hypothetical protein